MKALVILIVVFGVIVGGTWGGWVAYQTLTNEPPTYKSTEVKRGEIIATIGATGTLEPEETIDVGAQVAGIIDKFGADPTQPTKLVDFCSYVKKGDLLAHIDDITYQADWKTAVAQFEQAKANVELARANVFQADAKLKEAARDWERAQKVGPSDALSQNDYDMYEANDGSAQAARDVAIATLNVNQQAVVEADWNEKKAKRNLDFCTVNSPEDGVIIARRVNIGQTVVSSLSAPSLFLLAKDLKKMLVWASVNEADVGNIHAGQDATFTVDALPGETFNGKVSRVRYDAQMTQNVVTYTVEVAVDNSDLKLLPYMTANLQFLTAKHENAMIVPNTALRWVPIAADISPEVQNAAPHDSDAEDKNPAPVTGPSTQPAVRTSHGTLWVQQGRYVRPLHVRVGVSDGMNSEVFGADLKEGLSVVVNETRNSHH